MDDLSKAMQEATAYLDRQKDERPRPEPKNPAPKPATSRVSSAVRAKTKEVQGNPTLVLAYGAAIALAIVAGGITTQWLVPALGAGFGIATTIISKGLAGGSTDYSWVVPAGAAGLALIGGVATVILVIKIVKRASGELYLAALPLLAVLAGFCVDIYKDFYPNDPLVRVGFAAVTCGLYALGGLWWRRYGLLNKIAGTLLILISPLVILAHGVTDNLTQGLSVALGSLTTQSWIALGGLVTILLVTGLLAFTLGEEISP
jgi:hypothetical protein